MEQGDRLVGGALGGAEGIEGGLRRRGHGRQTGASPVRHGHGAAGVLPELEGGVLGDGVVNGHHHGGALDRQGPVVGGAGAAAAALVAGDGGIDYSAHLQLGDEPAQGWGIGPSGGLGPGWGVSHG